jgi:2-polyprenyl-3-methyl-5-hydroxy-6-metoxy-1,4-benzoquinol methylase
MALTENDIRPTNLEAGKLKALRKDLERLASQKSGFVPAVCPACGAETSVSEFNKYGFEFDRCTVCRTVYMNPRATPEILADFYAHSVLYEYWDEFIFPASREARMERIFRPRVARILELCTRWGVAPDLLVEVGAAGGMFCEEALRSGRFERVIGIEPGAAQAATCRSLGIEVIESTLEQVDLLEKPAQIIASFETIEHVFSPKTFLEHCRRLLAPGGLLVLTCPNYEGFDIMTLGALSDSLDAEHINMFNPTSLKHLVESLGFEVLELSTPGELDAELVRNKVLEGTLDLSGQHFLRKVLIDEWERLGSSFQEYLKAQCLSSHMWLSARLNR